MVIGEELRDTIEWQTYKQWAQVSMGGLQGWAGGPCMQGGSHCFLFCLFAYDAPTLVREGE